MNAAGERGAIRIGVGGWTYAPWRSNFFPDGLPQRRELEYASRRLTAIEVNGTFYGAQKPATYAKWRAETPEGFVFTLKAPRYATQRSDLAGAGKSVDAFVHGGLAELGDRLGAINWQLAEGKRFDREELARFFDLLPRELDGHPLRHALEVRDTSFACAALVELARRHEVAIVVADSEGHPAIADVTAPIVYARLRRSREEEPNGYPDAELDDWSRRARVWAEGGEPGDLPRTGTAPAARTPRDVFVFFINGAKERAPAAATALIARVG